MEYLGLLGAANSAIGLWERLRGRSQGTNEEDSEVLAELAELVVRNAEDIETLAQNAEALGKKVTLLSWGLVAACTTAIVAVVLAVLN